MVLGEIMMGGKVTTNLDYNYLMAFKNIYDLTKKQILLMPIFLLI